MIQEGELLSKKRHSDLVHDRKWLCLLRRSCVFRWFPFIDGVLVAGSMALGDTVSDSDFDVIVLARPGRLYTVRFFCLAVFKILGWRRRPERTADGFCFNHFVTPGAFRLRPPHNLYWQQLYRRLVPVYGVPAILDQFFSANRDWVKSVPSSISFERRFFHLSPAASARFLERCLHGRRGDVAERAVRRFQHWIITRNMRRFPPGYKPRVVLTDQEVELHLDTRRLETVKNRVYT